MKIVSWNVNGLNSCIKQGAFDIFYEWLPDVICIQETKTKETPIVIDGYHHFYVAAEKKRFSGSLIMTLEPVIAVIEGMGIPEFDVEARVLTIELDKYFIVNTYAPNIVDKLERQIFRIEWSKAYQDYISGLMNEKTVILCGDFNVCLSELDYSNDNRRRYIAEEEGFQSDERAAIEDILELGLFDAFRKLNPTKENAFTHWSNKGQGRLENKGARLDYFFVSNELEQSIRMVKHHIDILGSDHCPIELGGIK